MNDILMGALVGAAGQMTRAVAGIYKARKRGEAFAFDWVLFGSGVALGVVAGAGSAYGGAAVPTAFLAGYAGVDFIEAALKRT